MLRLLNTLLGGDWLPSPCHRNTVVLYREPLAELNKYPEIPGKEACTSGRFVPTAPRVFSLGRGASPGVLYTWHTWGNGRL